MAEQMNFLQVQCVSQGDDLTDEVFDGPKLLVHWAARSPGSQLIVDDHWTKSAQEQRHRFKLARTAAGSSVYE
jgi:hypothetical protein